MFQSLLTPLRSRFDLSPRTSNAELPPNSPNTNVFSPQSPFSIMSPGMKTPTTFALPNSAPQDDDLEPEEFARDVLVELMRTAVEGLKEVQLPQEERGKSRREILTEILHIMGQDPCTKDVFREMDGFLGIMSVLSTTDASFSATLTPETPTSPISDSVPTPFLVVRKGDPSQDAIDVLRLVFQILSEATKHHETNARYFSETVRFASIAHALRAIIATADPEDESDAKQTLTDHILSFLLALSLGNFVQPTTGFFLQVEKISTPDEVDDLVKGVAGQLGKEKSNLPGQQPATIERPEALELLWTLLCETTETDSDATEKATGRSRRLRYALFRVLETFYHVSHRNAAALATLGIAGKAWSIFGSLQTSGEKQAVEGSEGSNWTEKEKMILQKLLKRLVDIGTTTADARQIIQCAVHTTISPLDFPVQFESSPPVNPSNNQAPRRKKAFDAPSRAVEHALDEDVLDIIRHGMKSRWVEHLSLEGPRAAVILGDSIGLGQSRNSSPGLRSVVEDGWTFMVWLRLNDLPVLSSKPPSTSKASYSLLSIETPLRTLIRLSVGEDGKLQLSSRSPPSAPPSSLFSGPRHRSSSSVSATNQPALLSPPPLGGGSRTGHRSVSTSSHMRSPSSPSHFRVPPPLEFSEVTTPLAKSSIRKARWSHLSVVSLSAAAAKHYGIAGSAIKVLIDGIVTDIVPWSFPRLDHGEIARYVFGSLSGESVMSWSLASAYMLGVALPDELPRLIQHLGPRYNGDFLDPELIRFMTYEATASLNIFLHAATSSIKASSSNKARSPAIKEGHALVKGLKQGSGISESMIVFSFTASALEQSGFKISVPVRGVGGSAFGSIYPGLGNVNNQGHYTGRDGAAPMLMELEGDVFAVKAESLDLALWKIGGAAVALRLVQLAKTAHELSRTIGILCDGLRNSWQNSEDMERHRGYEVLADILRQNPHLINLTTFETLFEFLGVNFGSPEQSTLYNADAYRPLALDFSLWSQTSPQIQQAHFDHFSTLIFRSRYKSFNTRQRLNKMNLTRKILFALQADWYTHPRALTLQSFDKPPIWMGLIQLLKAAALSHWDKDDTIKPLASFLAANLAEHSNGVSSPGSVISAIDTRISLREKAEQVLTMLVEDILNQQAYYTKFAQSLPFTRLILLFLGEKPSSVIAVQILHIISNSIRISSSFSRKFELVSGWGILKTVLPGVWDADINQAAFDLLFGKSSIDNASGSRSATPTPISGSSLKARQKQERAEHDITVVSCTQIVPTILSALQTGLEAVAANCGIDDNGEVGSSFPWTSEKTTEILIEQLMTTHTASSTFRQLFESQQTTQLFIDSFKAMTTKLSGKVHLNTWNIRIVEKLTHFGLALALDNAVGGSQKREILDTIELAQRVVSPAPDPDRQVIDPGLVADTRTIRQRFASSRFSIQNVGQMAVTKTLARTAEWRKGVRLSERKRLRKAILDLRENRRQVSRLNEWTFLLTSERGLWPAITSRLWRLDETEGPHRVRKKLEPQDDEQPSSRVDGRDEFARDVGASDNDAGSILHLDIPPWAESYEIASTESDDHQQLADDVVDDKLRRIRHELEPGDVIEAVASVARIDGVDSSPGLLILGRTHIYMLDGVIENENGEVIEAKDAPKSLLFIPGSVVELDGPQKAQRWSHSQIATCSPKKFLFRDVALELYFRDSRSLLVVFMAPKKRAELEQRLLSIIRKLSPDTAAVSASSLTQRNPFFGKVGSRMLQGLKADELSIATRKWQAREISNFAYLSILNQISGRTPSDATQYPVFPWVLSDYESSNLDLNDPNSFRDLTKPMGALTPERRLAAETRFSNLRSVGETPFHYGTHFSSSMIVCHFLIRLAPFTNMFKTLQGGDWDLPDRLFSDMSRAYESSAHDLRGDVRELIPEFFTTPEFLENTANHDFGNLQQTGERIHDVKLPPWARKDPLLFVTLNRCALESPIVSEHLPAWIDLIWGYRQRDEDSLNVYHPLSYEGSIDLDNIKDDLEREATVGIIHNFGQTPRKLFNMPHPERNQHGLSTLPVGVLHGIEEDPHMLAQSARSFKDLGPTRPIRDFVLDSSGDKLLPCPGGVVHFPGSPHELVEWNSNSSDIRLVVDQKVVQVVEYAMTTCATFADSNCLVTGSSDYTVRLWKISRGSNALSTRLSLSHIMRVHTGSVNCVAASRAWSLVVSGSNDGSAALWDLNRGVYVRSIWHRNGEGQSDPVNLVAINESTGYIATCSRLTLRLHTVNARPIASLDLTATSSFSSMVPTITALAFHEREYSHLGVLSTGGPDGSITLRTWTADGTAEGERAQWEFLTIRTMKARIGYGATRPPCITALKFLGETLYHGEETGKAFAWTLPES